MAYAGGSWEDEPNEPPPLCGEPPPLSGFRGLDQQKHVIAQGVYGTVKWFMEERGYGFIKCEGTNEDLFVHKWQIRKDDRYLDKGEYVVFDVVQGKKGREAINVFPVDLQTSSSTRYDDQFSDVDPRRH